jgi:hypothetical protein
MSDALPEPGRNGQSPASFLRGAARPSLAARAAGSGPPRAVVGVAPLESPSLLTQEGGPAYEMKFLIGAAEAAQVEAWAGWHLPLDAHADPGLGNAYRTLSLYLDTPALDVYHRVKPYRRRKFRVRRYGEAPVVFLERKKRSGDRVSKQRTPVPEGQLPLLGERDPHADWPGAWFGQRVLEGGLRPVCLVGYERTAYAGLTAEGPLRLTLDRHVHCRPAAGWRLDEGHGGLSLLEGRVILELKFRGALPSLFKHLVEELRLTPGAASKYRLGVRAWGLDGGRGADV